LLHEFGRVLVMDIVGYEASDDASKPWAREVVAWLAKGREPGTNQPVDIVTTEIGEAYRLARLTNPDFKMRNAAENAIRDWLVDTLPEIGGPALVVYEDKRMPKLIRREHLEEVVVLATTRAILSFAEARGLIDSAEEVWNDIVKSTTAANPRQDVQVLRPTRSP
jgi:hypothetical protein